MATTFTAANLQVVGNVYSLTIPTLYLPEGSAQTFAAGDLLKYSSGRVIVAADSDSAAILVGQAQGAATGVAGTLIPVTPFLPGTLIEATFTTDGGTLTTAASDAELGVIYEMGLKNTHTFFINQAVPRAALATAKTGFAMPLSWAHGRTSTNVWQKAIATDIDPRVLALVMNSAFIDRVDTNIAS